MITLKNLRIVLIVVLPVILLILLYNSGNRHFTADTAKAALPAQKNANLIAPENLDKLKGEKLIINIDDSAELSENQGREKRIRIPASELTKSENIKKLKRNHGALIIESADNDKAARAWMLLAQLGVDNLYILQN